MMKMLRALRSVFGNASAVSGLTVVFIALNLFLNFPFTQVTVVLLGLWVVLFILKPEISRDKLARIKTLFTPTGVVLLFSAFIIILFLQKFPPGDWNKIVFYDDMTACYTASVNGIETLKHGGLFGWDSRMLGGYYQVSDVPTYRPLFLLPFALVFGSKIGYHALIFFFYILFPFLCRAYVLINLKDQKMGAATFAFASVFLATFFVNLFGMIDNLMGLNFFVLNLCLLEKIKGGSRLSAFFLSLTVSLTMFAHISFFIATLIFFALELLWARERKFSWTVFFILGFAFFMTLSFSFYFIYYHKWFNSAIGIYWGQRTFITELATTFRDFFRALNVTRALNSAYRFEDVAVLFLPAAAFAYFKGNAFIRKICLYSLVVFVLVSLGFQTVVTVKTRMCYLTAFLAPILLSFLLIRNASQNKYQDILLAPLLLIPLIFLGLDRPYPHVPSLPEAFPGLCRELKSMRGNMIFLESQVHDNMLIEQKLPAERSLLPHLEPQLSRDLGVRFLSTPLDNVHFSVYHANIIQGGLFRGHPIEYFPVDTLKALLTKWGVEYVVVWSERGKNYFSKAGPAFAAAGTAESFAIFRYLEADPRSVALRQGSGSYEQPNSFRFDVSLKDAVKGDTAVVRQNYFPSWRAFAGNRELPVFSVNGQMGIVVPEGGDRVIELRFPKYRIFSLLALIAIICSFLFFAWPGIFRRSMPAPAKQEP